MFEVVIYAFFGFRQWNDRRDTAKRDENEMKKLLYDCSYKPNQQNLLRGEVRQIKYFKFSNC